MHNVYWSMAQTGRTTAMMPIWQGGANLTTGSGEFAVDAADDFARRRHKRLTFSRCWMKPSAVIRRKGTQNGIHCYRSACAISWAHPVNASILSLPILYRHAQVCSNFYAKIAILTTLLPLTMLLSSMPDTRAGAKNCSAMAWNYMNSSRRVNKVVRYTIAARACMLKPLARW